MQKLESLHTGVGYHKDEEGGVIFVDMYAALEVFGGLPGLGTLNLEIDGLDDARDNARWIAGFGRLCPNVERFWGDMSVRWVTVSPLCCSDVVFSCAHVCITSSRYSTRIYLRPTLTSNHKCCPIWVLPTVGSRRGMASRSSWRTIRR